MYSLSSEELVKNLWNKRLRRHQQQHHQRLPHHNRSQKWMEIKKMHQSWINLKLKTFLHVLHWILANILGLKRVSFQNTDLFLSKTNRFLALTHGYQIIVINYIFNRGGVCQNALRDIEFEGKDDVISRIDSGTFPANEDEMVNGAARKAS